MRLTCPNCGAQYEVPGAVIPETGRDVQCSNCGTTWFQHHADNAPPEPGAEPQPAPGAAPEPEPIPEPGPSAAAGRRIDPSIAGILREEADRERAARAAEADGRIETQPDLGLTEPEPDEARRARQARDRMQRLRGAPPAVGGETTPRDHTGADEGDDDEDDGIDPGSRRNLFPDIEEINSSLSASEHATGSLAPVNSEDMPSTRRRGGFRTGFRLAVLTCIMALTVYLTAPRIAGLWPAAEAPLAQYVHAVDAGRAMLSATVAGLIARF